MGIKEISVTNGAMHESATISFNKGNIASVVGINGSGKSQLIKSIAKSLTTSYATGKKTDVSIKFDISDEDKEKMSNWPIFIDFETFGIKFEDIFDRASWKECTQNLNKAIIDWVFTKIEQISKLDGSYKNFEQQIIKIKEMGESELVYDTLTSHLSANPSWHNIKTNQNLSQTMNKMREWNNSMPSIVKVKQIDSSSLPNMGTINIKPDGGLDFQHLVAQDNTWFVRLFSYFGLEKNLVGITRANADEIFQLSAEQISDKLTELISQPGLSAKLAISENYRGSGLYYLSITFQEGENAIAYDGLSSGTKRFVNTILKIGSVNENTVILLDEPDANLHPYYQMLLRTKFEELTSETKCRIVIATHSVHMLNGQSNHMNTYVSEKNGPKTAMLYKITDYHRKIEDYSDLQIWNILGYKQEDLDPKITKDSKILIVEGETDKIYLNAFFKQAKDNFLENIYIIPALGVDKIPYKALYFIEAKNVDKSNIYCYFDGDAKDNSFVLKKLEEIKVNMNILPFDTIENVFEGNDKAKYFKNGTNKVENALKFSLNTSNLDEGTIENIGKVIQSVKELLGTK